MNDVKLPAFVLLCIATAIASPASAQMFQGGWYVDAAAGQELRF